MQEITVQKDVPAEMRDGTVLMSNVYRPAGDGEYPVLLTRTPYGKDLALTTAYLDPVRASGEGYVVVVQDVRGRYRSEGKFTPFVYEYEDGYDTVEWAAKLPGANGSVGMYGVSYFGKTQVAGRRDAAARAEEHGARYHLGQPPQRLADARRGAGARAHPLLGGDIPGYRRPAP